MWTLIESNASGKRWQHTTGAMVTYCPILGHYNPYDASLKPANRGCACEGLAEAKKYALNPKPRKVKSTLSRT